MKTVQVTKRLVLGRTMATAEMGHTLLPKAIVLPVFSSDALSSVAYATQEILLVLGTAGAVAITNLIPISFAVATLLALVVVSYRQTVRAYPNGGGAYIVSRENLGDNAGLLAASALLIDYILTVAVSITAGTEAVLTAIPELADLKIEIAIVFIAFVALINLRGVKESGVFFAVPTYLFIVSIYVLLATGFVRCLGGCPVAEIGIPPPPCGLAAGCLPHPESVRSGNDCPHRRRGDIQRRTCLPLSPVQERSGNPHHHGHDQHLHVPRGLMVAQQMQIRYVHGQETSVLGDIAHTVFGGGLGFYVVQIATAAILILAANTAFADFPRLSSILAKDRFLPRQLMNRGDRLVFSNGVVILSVLAAALVVAFGADLNRLIQLYLVGVFVSFTLSQLGMVVHWRKFRERGWQRSIVINAVGATMTGLVLCVVIATKFLTGAWIVICAIPFLMVMMRSVHRHYMAVAVQLEHPDRVPVDRRPGDQHVVILVTDIDDATLRAVGYTRAIRPKTVSAITFDERQISGWHQVAPEIPIVTLGRKGRLSRTVTRHLLDHKKRLPPTDFLTLVIPEVLKRKGLLEIMLRPKLHRLKRSLMTVPDVQVLDVPVVATDGIGVSAANEPARNYAIVLISGVHNATLQAIEYAESLNPSDIRALTIGLDPEESERLGDKWLEQQIPIPLEMQESPFRDIGQSIVDYLRPFKADGVHKVVTVILPEFVVGSLRHQVLHGQTALLIKRNLLFETGVVLASVPYQLDEKR